MMQYLHFLVSHRIMGSEATSLEVFILVVIIFLSLLLSFNEYFGPTQTTFPFQIELIPLTFS